jgi:hypothetical protein
MNFLMHHAPIVMSACAGLIYGCSFVLQQRGFLFKNGVATHPAEQALFFLLRIFILFSIGRYLLRSAGIPSILGTLTFFSMFWLVILLVKAHKYERV